MDNLFGMLSSLMKSDSLLLQEIFKTSQSTDVFLEKTLDTIQKAKENKDKKDDELYDQYFE